MAIEIVAPTHHVLTLATNLGEPVPNNIAPQRKTAPLFDMQVRKTTRTIERLRELMREIHEDTARANRDEIELIYMEKVSANDDMLLRTFSVIEQESCL